MRKFLSNLFFNHSIKFTVPFVVLSITVVSIFITAVLAINSVTGIGVETQNVSAEALANQTKDFLVQIAQTTANNNDLIFEKISKDAESTAAFASNIFDNSRSFARGVYWKFDKSVFKGAGGQYLNSKNEVSSVFIPSYIPINETLKREMELGAYLDFVFPKVLESNSNTVAVYFIGKGGEARYYPNIDLGNVLLPDTDSTKEVFYAPATPENSPEKKVKWSVVYDDPAGQGPVISAIAPIYTKQNGFIGVIGIDVALKKIINSIENTNPVPNTSLFLIDKNGAALALSAHLYKDIFGKDEKENESRVDLSNLGNEFGSVIDSMKRGENGFKRTIIGGDAHYVAYANLASTGFSLGVVAEEGEILAVTNNLQEAQKESVRKVIYFQLIPIGLLILMFAWILDVFFIRFLIKPLNDLALIAKKIPESDFSVKYNFPFKNEIGQLAEAFNKMSDELKKLHGGMKKTIEEQTIKLKEKLLSLEEAKKTMSGLLEDSKIAQHHIAKEKDKMDVILHSIGDGVFVVDENLKVILINKVAANMVGYKMNEILGTKYTDKMKFIFEDTGETNEQFINKAIETRVIQEMSNHTMLVNKNGNKIQVADSAAPLLDGGGKVIGCVVVFRDITKEREVDRAKTEFVSLASHQLRTPLSAINWYTEMLLAGDAGEVNEEQKKYLGEVALGNKRMVDLVNSLLNVSRLDLGTFIIEPEPTNIIEMAISVVGELQPQITEKKLKMEESYGENIPEFQADKRLLRIVFQNLLSNAVKYTSALGTVKLELMVAQKGQIFGGKDIKEDSITIKTSDTGIGIPTNQKDKIFSKMFRADNARQTETEGTGLGLYIIKSIVDHSNGSIWFESEENKGTTFYVVFPLSGMKKREGTKKLD